jgi:hypothetical protein
MRGELHVLTMMPVEVRSDNERLTDQVYRAFKVTARLSKTPLPAGDIKGDFTQEDGDSYLQIPSEYVFSRVRCREGVFEIKKNSKGEQSVVEFECEAGGVSQAKALFLNAVLPFLDHQAYLANCPVFVAMVRVEDSANRRSSFDYVSPYREVVINPHNKALNSALAPVYALYRDAKNSHSDFYTFLCYHKILDGLLGSIKAAVRTRAEKKKVQLSVRRDLVPSSEHISSEFKTWAGKPIKKFFDDVMTPQFRNAIAHFITKDGAVLNLSAPEQINRYASILYVSELCVREVIETHEQWHSELSTT